MQYTEQDSLSIHNTAHNNVHQTYQWYIFMHPCGRTHSICSSSFNCFNLSLKNFSVLAALHEKNVRLAISNHSCASYTTSLTVSNKLFLPNCMSDNLQKLNSGPTHRLRCLDIIHLPLSFPLFSSLVATHQHVRREIERVA